MTEKSSIMKQSNMATLLENLQETTITLTVDGNNNAGKATCDLDEENPFMIDKVMKCISKHLDFQGLQVCRGLNHLWKETTEEFWLKNCPPLRITSNDSPGSMSISNFLQMYSDSSHPIPISGLVKKYRNFILFDFDNKQDIPILHEFLLQVGPQIEALELNKVILCRKLQDVVDILCCRYTPKLKSFRVSQVHMTEECVKSLEENPTSWAQGQKENKYLNRLHFEFVPGAAENLDILRAPVSWLDVLSLYSNLRVFIAWDIPKHVFGKIICAMGIIRNDDDSKLALKELECLNKIRPINEFTKTRGIMRNAGDLLESAKLPLESLSIDLELERSASSELIESYHETLKKLIFKGLLLLPTPFPFLWALEELTLVGCENMGFLDQVPNLKSLNLDYKAQLFNFPSDITPLEFLTVFKCNNEDKWWKEKELRELFLWMPNVQRLELRLTNTTFSVVCEYFPNLKELTVLGDMVDDYGIVGGVKRVPHPGEGELLYSVINLRELQTFKMVKLVMDDFGKGKGLTDKSVICGFCYMPKLSKLVIPVRFPLSTISLRALHSRIKDIQINVVGASESY